MSHHSEPSRLNRAGGRCSGRAKEPSPSCCCCCCRSKIGRVCELRLRFVCVLRCVWPQKIWIPAPSFHGVSSFGRGLEMFCTAPWEAVLGICKCFTMGTHFETFGGLKAWAKELPDHTVTWEPPVPETPIPKTEESSLYPICFSGRS